MYGPGFSFGVQVVGLRVQGSEFGDQGFVSRIQGPWCWVQAVLVRSWVQGLRVQGLVLMV